MTSHFAKTVRFKMPKNMKPTVIPLYSGVYYFTTDREAYAQTYEFLIEERTNIRDQLDSCVGMVTPLTCDGRASYLVGVFDGGYNTLTHELGHLALFVMERAGVPVDGSNSEAFCYLIGHFADETTDIVNEFRALERAEQIKEERRAAREKARQSAPETKAVKGARRGRN